MNEKFWQGKLLSLVNFYICLFIEFSTIYWIIEIKTIWFFVYNMSVNVNLNDNKVIIKKFLEDSKENICSESEKIIEKFSKEFIYDNLGVL